MDSSETELYNIYLLAGGLILFIIFFFLFGILRMQNKFRRRVTKELEAEVSALENERKRMADDLHDDIGPVLTAAKMKISCINTSSPQDEILLNKSIEYIETLTEKIRMTASGLMPAAFPEQGPVRAIEQFISNLSFHNTLPIQLDAEELPKLHLQQSVHIYRIVQEIIHNTFKHAKATKLHISIYTQKKFVIISTADDGIGFNYKNEMERHQGYGLQNMQSRVLLLQGNINVISEPGTGSKYYIEIPLSIFNLKKVA